MSGPVWGIKTGGVGQVERCSEHEGTRHELSQLGDLARQHLTWQSGFEARMDSLIELSRQSQETQRDIKKEMHGLAVNMATNYVTKGEFVDYCKDSEKRTVRVHERLDAIGLEQKQNLWKVIGLFVPISAIVFSFITWLWGVM